MLVDGLEVPLQHLDRHVILVEHVDEASEEVHCRLDIPLLVVPHEFLVLTQLLPRVHPHSDQLAHSYQVNVSRLRVRLKQRYQVSLYKLQVRYVQRLNALEEILALDHDLA